MPAANIAHPTPTPDDGRIGFLGIFASPAVESAFRELRFRDDRWWSEFLITAGMLRVGVFLLADYREVDGPVFWLLFASRLLFILISAWVLVAMRRTGSTALAYRLFFGWGLLIVAVTACMLSARAPSEQGLPFMSFAMVFVTYCVTPLALPRQATLALVYSAAVLYVTRHTDGATLATVAATHAMSHLFGAITSWRLNHRRREVYLGTVREAQLRTRLEAAMAEVRTLRGMLCICAWCKRIRNEESWEPLEVYVRERTHASFSHGMCPDCFESQREELARLRG